VRTQTHKSLVAVVSNVSLTDETSHFYRALVRAINQELDGQELTPRVYDGSEGMNKKETFFESPTIHRVLTDLENYPFAGLIALGWPKDWPGPKALAELPRAQMAGKYGEPDVSFDSVAFGFESLAHLHRAGRNRIVYLRTYECTTAYQHDLRGLEQASKLLGIEVPMIIQFDCREGGSAIELEAYRKTEQLIEQWRQSGSWADALLISDDIGARGAALALLKHGVRVPEDMTFLTAANEGIQHHYGIPVVKYEFSPRALARQLVTVLHRQMEDGNAANEPNVMKGGIIDPIDSRRTQKNKQREVHKESAQ